MEHENNYNQKNLVQNGQNHPSKIGLGTNADRSSTRSIVGHDNITFPHNYDYSSLQGLSTHHLQYPQHYNRPYPTGDHCYTANLVIENGQMQC